MKDNQTMTDITTVDMAEAEPVASDREADTETSGPAKKQTTIEAINSTPTTSKKKVIIERLILCTALFFPLFLATLDTSILFLHICTNFSDCRYCITSYNQLDIILRS